jgi:Asp-tRNA(Asn)/Glu-tRNA(Gln) amidotransferase A subunit family amidase
MGPHNLGAIKLFASTAAHEISRDGSAYADSQLILTNLTGHPAVIVPNGLRGNDAPQAPPVDTGDDDRIGGPGTPVSLTFIGGLYNDSALLAFASAYQRETGFHHLHPAGF